MTTWRHKTAGNDDTWITRFSRRGRTTILISHRVSTVQTAGWIFVIEHGEIAEQGTHAELITSGGYYADLYQKQLLEEELEAI